MFLALASSLLLFRNLSDFFNFPQKNADFILYFKFSLCSLVLMPTLIPMARSETQKLSTTVSLGKMTVPDLEFVEDLILHVKLHSDGDLPNHRPLIFTHMQVIRIMNRQSSNPVSLVRSRYRLLLQASNVLTRLRDIRVVRCRISKMFSVHPELRLSTCLGLYRPRRTAPYV
ncbi:hypothetical protein DL98DRAFT_311904 [Cadophora sp. DSE1049]|nr:hypothetical protein DL98DRAFT_311904 [Cadophora sp. DSE1049]